MLLAKICCVSGFDPDVVLTNKKQVIPVYENF